MGKYLDRTHNKKGVPTEFRNRIDLDTALKERGMDGLYGRKKRALEQKELHRFLVKRSREVGENRAKQEAISGKLFNKTDMQKL